VLSSKLGKNYTLYNNIYFCIKNQMKKWFLFKCFKIRFKLNYKKDLKLDKNDQASFFEQAFCFPGREILKWIKINEFYWSFLLIQNWRMSFLKDWLKSSKQEHGNTKEWSPPRKNIKSTLRDARFWISVPTII